MFDSYVMTLFHRLYSKIKIFYNKSYLKKIETKLGENLSLIAKSSILVKHLSSEGNAENIKTYNLYVKVINLIDKIFTFFRNIFKKYSKNSCAFSLIKKLFDSKKATIETISAFILSFSVSLITMIAINRNLNLEIATILLVFFISAILAILNSNKISIAINKSFVVNLIKDIFTIENEEDISWK